jgi:hypothetical protein
MADQLYLSYWLHGYTENNMLRHFEKMLKLFPYSRLARQGAVLRIIPINYNEPAIFERAYPSPIDLADVLAAAKEFEHADSCYRLETYWDLWQFETDWHLAPSRATLCCFGPEFESEAGENLGIEFGIESLFLPQPEVPGSLRMIQSNIKSLLKLVHDIDDRLSPERRLLWSESGGNFPDKLQQALSQAS